MDNEKGKGAEQSRTTPPGGQHHGAQEPSFISRVAASAKGLTRDTFSSQRGADVEDTLATALSSSGKDTSRGTSNGLRPTSEGSASTHVPGTSESHSGNHGPANQFRSRQTEDHVKHAENEFSNFIDGIDSFQPSSNITTQPDSNAFETTWRQREKSYPVAVGSRTVAEQELQDGADVIALLNIPTTTQDFELPEDESDRYDWGFDEGQLALIRTITQELFSTSGSQKVKYDNSLNLVHAVDPTNAVVLSGSTELSVEWWEQWDGVLRRYADEVWGDLLPLVKEARKEMEDVTKDEPITEVPDAVRRLQSILGHLQRR